MLQRVVVAVDGSASADRAVLAAADVAEASGAEVVVVHVDPVVVGWAFAAEAEKPEEAANIADGAVRTLKDRGVSARSEVLTAPRGLIGREIIAVAEHEGAGLIVMGSRGLGDLSGLLVGSVTHKVLHLAHVPVLVVR